MPKLKRDRPTKLVWLLALGLALLVSRQYDRFFFTAFLLVLDCRSHYVVFCDSISNHASGTSHFILVVVLSLCIRRIVM